MVLRKKTLLIIGATLVGLVVILYAASQYILVNSFADLEAQETRQSVERALSALSDELLALDSVAYDWAVWDDTYAFIEDVNQDYIESNILDSTFTGLRINFLLFVDATGRRVFERGFDLEEEVEISIPPSLQQYLVEDSVLLRHDDTNSRVMGIVPLPENPLLVASRPILTSEGEGPVRGTLIIGRYLETTEIERLAEKTYLSLTIHRFNEPQMPPDFQPARSLLVDGEAIVVQPLGTKSVAGYAFLNDINGQPVLILRVDLPRRIWNQGQTSISYFIVSLMVAGLVFGVVTVLLLERFVLSRLAHLGAEVGWIGRSSSFAARVSMIGDDELTRLAGAINRMLAALQQSQVALQEAHDELEHRVEARTKELAQANQALQSEVAERARAQAAEREQHAFAEALREITAALTSTLDLDEVLAGILTNVGLVVPHDAANIMLIESGVARIVYSRGYAGRTSEEAMRARRYVVADVPYQRRMTATHRPIVISDTRADPSWVDIPEARWVRSYAGVPIILGEEVIGFINLDGGTPGFFIPDHAERLRAFADQAAVALENARLYNQAKQVAALEERSRLANDLHDAVSQMLFSANLIADVLPTLWMRDVEAGKRSLEQLRRLTRGALAEMRALLLELRPAALEEADLDDMLCQLVEAIASRTGIDIALTIELERSLPTDVRVTLYRIAQESLNNVVRHALADQVTVALRSQADTVVLSISDNGRGFDPDNIPAGHLGLDIMRERAETIGATLTFTSRLNQGTHIRVVWKDATKA